MAISQNTALFSLLGTQYGGDGKTTFGLPDFGGRSACGTGKGPGLTQRTQGETFGEDAVTLLGTQMPSHSHRLNMYPETDPGKSSDSPATRPRPCKRSAARFAATPATPTTFAATTCPGDIHRKIRRVNVDST